MENVVFDSDNCRVVAEDDSFVLFYTDELTCQDFVVNNVVKIYNDNKHDKSKMIELLDNYLLDEEQCTSDDREIILENIYKTSMCKL